MKKEISEMTDRELLMELVEETRRAGRMRRVKTILWIAAALVVFVLACLYLPKLSALLRHYNAVMNSLESATARVNESLEEFKILAGEAQGFFDQVNQLGLDKLQEALDELHGVMEQIGSFFHFGS